MQSLRNSQQFRRVYEHGKKIHTAFFSAFYLKNEAGERRYGITATRKIGCAVIRNRCKRRLREIMRKHELYLSSSPGCSPGSYGFDLVLNAKRELAEADFNRLEEAFERVMTRFCYEMDRNSTSKSL